MITEDYVSFEVAKLLKSKKFHIPTRSHYDGRGGFGFSDICEIDWNNYKCFRERRCYSAPTLQMAMKWLRENYNFFIEIHYGNVGTPEEPKVQWWWELINKQGEFLECNITDGNTTYEEACESAIKYSLRNLI